MHTLPTEARRGSQIPRAGVTGGCELSWGVLGMERRSLGRTVSSLNSAPGTHSHQPLGLRSGVVLPPQPLCSLEQ